MSFIYRGSILGSVVSLLIVPLSLVFVDYVYMMPAFVLELGCTRCNGVLGVYLMVTLSLFLAVLFIVLVHLLVTRDFLAACSVVSSGR